MTVEEEEDDDDGCAEGGLGTEVGGITELVIRLGLSKETASPFIGTLDPSELTTCDSGVIRAGEEEDDDEREVDKRGGVAETVWTGIAGAPSPPNVKSSSETDVSPQILAWFAVPASSKKPKELLVQGEPEGEKSDALAGTSGNE